MARPIAQAGSIVVLAWVGAALLALELGLRFAFPMAPDALALVRRMPVSARAQTGQRLAAALAKVDGDSKRLAIVAGLSSVREGIDPAVLDSTDSEARRWLVVATGGGMMRQLADLLRPVTAWRVTPAVVVLGLHPQWLAAPIPGSLARGAGPWTDQRDAVTRALWSLGNRNELALLGRDLMGRARRWWLPRVGVSVGQAYGVAPDLDGLAVEEGQRASLAHMRLQMSNWEDVGWFQPAQYRIDGVEARALTDLLATLNARTRVLVVLMPASRAWDQATPAVATEVLRTTVAAYVPDADVLDLSARFHDHPDAMFDHSHVNAAGRAVLSDAIGRWVSQRLAR